MKEDSVQVPEESLPSAKCEEPIEGAMFTHIFDYYLYGFLQAAVLDDALCLEPPGLLPASHFVPGLIRRWESQIDEVLRDVIALYYVRCSQHVKLNGLPVLGLESLQLVVEDVPGRVVPMKAKHFEFVADYLR
jgi:hypothetical protein